MSPTSIKLHWKLFKGFSGAQVFQMSGNYFPLDCSEIYSMSDWWGEQNGKSDQESALLEEMMEGLP